MGIKFNPSSTKETNYLMDLVSQFAIADWKQQQELRMLEKKIPIERKGELDLYKEKLKLQRDAMTENFNRLKTMGLFPETGQAGTEVSPYAKTPISPYELGKVDLETGMPSVNIRSPEDIKGLQFQQDVGRFKSAKTALPESESFGKMTPEQRYAFIQPRMKNVLVASKAYGELRPQFISPSGEERQFTQNEKGLYREVPNMPQAVIDPNTGEVLYNRPKGAVFQPRETITGKSANFEENIKVKLSQGENLTPEEINYYNKFMWRSGQEMKAPKKDKFGYTMGQSYKGYKYIGNNQWQRAQ